jgi:hypothetical protein
MLGLSQDASCQHLRLEPLAQRDMGAGQTAWLTTHDEAAQYEHDVAHPCGLSCSS